MKFVYGIKILLQHYYKKENIMKLTKEYVDKQCKIYDIITALEFQYEMWDIIRLEANAIDAKSRLKVIEFFLHIRKEAQKVVDLCNEILNENTKDEGQK